MHEHNIFWSLYNAIQYKSTKKFNVLKFFSLAAGVLQVFLNAGFGVEIEIDQQLSVSSHFSDLLVVNRTHDYSPD
jgi:hypothetical protein